MAAFDHLYTAKFLKIIHISFVQKITVYITVTTVFLAGTSVSICSAAFGVVFQRHSAALTIFDFLFHGVRLKKLIADKPKNFRISFLKSFI